VTVLDDAFARRDEAKIRYLRDYLKVGGRSKTLAAFGMADVAAYLPPDQRLAVGIAFGKADDSPGLALRVSKRDGIAHRAAREISEELAKDGSWADIRIVENIAVPARADVAAVKPSDGFPLGGDPLMLGVSVSHPKSPAGSLGGFVRFTQGGEGIISACHILANSGRGVDISSTDKAPMIYHPASADVPGRLTPRNQIARLQNYVTLDTASVELDVAVAELLPNRTHIGNVIPRIQGVRSAGKRITKPPKYEEVAKFRTVAKVGRMTGYTEGRLSAGFFDDVGLDVPGLGIVYYSRLFEVESTDETKPFAQPGDSGAVIFDVTSRSGFAIVTGGGLWDDDGKSRMLVYSCNLGAALEAMNATWL
jgi:hypothetical protein